MLVFYARAHATAKVKDVLSLLTSLCLAQSTSVPQHAAMDATLASLLTFKRSSLNNLAATDALAAAALTSQLSGYATLRRFYDLRDQDLNLGATTSFKPLERKRQAANALLAIIASASDCIRGGLFDSAVQSVVPVNGLIVLLAEILPLCGQTKRILARTHIYTLLRVIEDYNACPASLRASAEELLKTCVQSSTPTLSKSHSNASSTSGLGGSSYDLLVTSSILLKQQEKSAPLRRAWDWRIGLIGLQASDVSADSILLMLRVALANELGRLPTD